MLVYVCVMTPCCEWCCGGLHRAFCIIIEWDVTVVVLFCVSRYYVQFKQNVLCISKAYSDLYATHSLSRSSPLLSSPLLPPPAPTPPPPLFTPRLDLLHFQPLFLLSSAFFLIPLQHDHCALHSCLHTLYCVAYWCCVHYITCLDEGGTSPDCYHERALRILSPILPFSSSPHMDNNNANAIQHLKDIRARVGAPTRIIMVRRSGSAPSSYTKLAMMMCV